MVRVIGEWTDTAHPGKMEELTLLGLQNEREPGVKDVSKAGLSRKWLVKLREVEHLAESITRSECYNQN